MRPGRRRGFYLALLIGGFFLFSAIFVSCSPLYPDLRGSAIASAYCSTTWSIQFRCTSPGAPCTLPRSSTAGWGPSERSSIRRGACRHRIGGAASQAFERGPGSLRPQARYRASRRPWSAPVLIRRGGSPQALKVRANLRLKGSPSVMRGRREACDLSPSARGRTCRGRAADPCRTCRRATSRASPRPACARPRRPPSCGSVWRSSGPNS